MLIRTSLKFALHLLFLPGLVACGNAGEVSGFGQELFPEASSGNLKWDYDEITHKLIVSHDPAASCELFKLKADAIEVKSVITSVMRRI